MKEQEQFLWQCVDKWAASKPDAEALVFGDTRMTWAQLADAVDRNARAFLEIGVRRGDCIAMVSMARPEFIISFMAAAKISAIWTGISPRFSIGETGRVLRECRPTVLITLDRYDKSNLLERARTFSFEMGCIREVLVIGEAAPHDQTFNEYIAAPRPQMEDLLAERMAQASDDEEVLLMFTSGSSGAPKGVLHSHRGLLSNVRQQRDLFEINHDSRILLHFPINHVAADVEIGLCALHAGAAIVMMDNFDASRTLDIIDKEQITVLGQVPTMYMLELRSDRFSETKWDSVKTFVWGGSTAPRDVIDMLADISKRTGAHMITGYGATELGGFVTATRASDSVAQLARQVGVGYDNCDIRIVDEERRPLDTGEVGEIAVRGPVVMKGYLNSPAQTAEVVDKEGWYYTSDLGMLDASGVLTICGRRSEMFKTGGENVFPCEVEAVLEAHPDVLYAAVVAVPDDVFDEVCHAHIMASQGMQIATEDLLTWCRQRLADYKIPRVICIHESLPLLPNGKIDKRRLREML